MNLTINIINRLKAPLNELVKDVNKVISGKTKEQKKLIRSGRSNKNSDFVRANVVKPQHDIIKGFTSKSRNDNVSYQDHGFFFWFHDKSSV